MKATPVCRAFSIAIRIARAAPTWPMLLLQSISAVDAFSRTTTRLLFALMTPFRIRST